MTPESLKQAANATKQMSLDEAYKILGSDSNAGIEEVMKVRRNLCRPSQCSRVECLHNLVIQALNQQITFLFAAICPSHAAK